MRDLKVSYSDIGEGGVAVNFEKKHNVSEHPIEQVFWVPNNPTQKHKEQLLIIL